MSELVVLCEAHHPVSTIEPSQIWVGLADSQEIQPVAFTQDIAHQDVKEPWVMREVYGHAMTAAQVSPRVSIERLLTTGSRWFLVF